MIDRKCFTIRTYLEISQKIACSLFFNRNNVLGNNFDTQTSTNANANPVNNRNNFNLNIFSNKNLDGHLLNQYNSNSVIDDVNETINKENIPNIANDVYNDSKKAENGNCNLNLSLSSLNKNSNLIALPINNDILVKRLFDNKEAFLAKYEKKSLSEEKYYKSKTNETQEI